MTAPTVREVRDIGEMIDMVGEYIGLTHDAPWPAERVAAREALVELGRLAAASRLVEKARREERERCARVAEITPLEAYCTRAHRAQAAYNREQIVAAIRALPDDPERDGA